MTNANGGTYIVISPYGWQMDKNPFRAFMLLAEQSLVTGSFPKAADRKSNGSIFDKSDDGVLVYFVKDEDKFAGTSWFHPIDEDDNPIGVLVYGGDRNVNRVATLDHVG